MQDKIDKFKEWWARQPLKLRQELGKVVMRDRDIVGVDPSTPQQCSSCMREGRFHAFGSLYCQSCYDDAIARHGGHSSITQRMLAGAEEHKGDAA